MSRYSRFGTAYTDTEKAVFNKAMARLRQLGYVTRQNFMCCGSCASAEDVIRNADKAVYFSRQNSLKDEGYVYLNWSGKGAEIVRTFRDFGFMTEWDGTETECVKVFVAESAVAKVQQQRREFIDFEDNVDAKFIKGNPKSEDWDAKQDRVLMPDGRKRYLSTRVADAKKK